MKNKLFDRNIRNMFLKLLPVQIFVVIASSLSGTINAIVVGNYFEASAMVALGFATPIISFITPVSQVICGGCTIHVGQSMGRGENDKIDSSFTTSILILLFLGSFISAACLLFSRQIVSLFGVTADVLEITSSYFRGIVIGTVPLLLVPCFMTILQMCNHSNFSLFSTILLAILNYIYGIANAKVFHGGIFGIGLSSSLSEYTILLLMILYAIKNKLWKFKLSDFDFKLIPTFIKFGLAGVIANFLYALRNSIINKLCNNIGGTEAVSAVSVILSSGGIFDAFNIGVFATFKMLVGIYIGERDTKSIKTLIKIAILSGLVLAISKSIVIYASGDLIAKVFGAEGHVIELAHQCYKLYTLAAPLNIFVATLLSVFVGLGDVIYVNIVYFISAVAAPLGVCLLLQNVFGLNGIWSCYWIAEVITFVAMYIIIAIRKKKLFLTYTEFLALDILGDENNNINISVKKMEDVVVVAQNIEKYCLDCGIDTRRSKLAGLCLEEMAGNIVDHGFNKDKKNHSIDIFCLVVDDEVNIRLRDDCKGFDPHSKLGTADNDDPCKNIGIKMIFKLAKDIHYQTTFGMNVLSIKL